MAQGSRLCPHVSSCRSKTNYGAYINFRHHRQILSISKKVETKSETTTKILFKLPEKNAERVSGYKCYKSSHVVVTTFLSKTSIASHAYGIIIDLRLFFGDNLNISWKFLLLSNAIRFWISIASTNFSDIVRAVWSDENQKRIQPKTIITMDTKIYKRIKFKLIIMHWQLFLSIVYALVFAETCTSSLHKIPW